MTNAILQLQEGGKLHVLKEKWWKRMRGGGQCEVKLANICHKISQFSGENKLMLGIFYLPLTRLTLLQYRDKCPCIDDLSISHLLLFYSGER